MDQPVLIFSLRLEKFGVNVVELAEPVHTRTFHAWIEDWEKEILKKNDCVAEAMLLEKYKGLVFFDPDNNCSYTIWNKNLEFQRGRGGGWCAIGVPADKSLDDEPFLIGDMLVDLVKETEQDGKVSI